jgi:hypothetical protein
MKINNLSRVAAAAALAFGLPYGNRITVHKDHDPEPVTLRPRIEWSDDILHKPVPRRPARASYRTQVREARRRRNIQKRGGR